MFSKNSLIGLSTALILCLISILYFKYFIEKANEFLLDNPTEQSIQITLNNESYFLAPGQSVAVKVNKGKNKLSAIMDENKKIILDTTLIISNTQRGIINPTHSSYFIFTRYYGYIQKLDSIYKSKEINIDGKIYHGDIKESNEVLIQNFYLNINQSFPKLINKVDSLETRSKIFRKNEFLDFYQSKYE